MAVKPIKRLVKRLRYSADVESRLDPRRPKYSEAVKSLAAFAPDERKFRVLVSHLDAACTEALDVAHERGTVKFKR